MLPTASYKLREALRKSVFIRSYSGPRFPAFGLKRRDTPYLSVFSPNVGKCGPE